MHRATEFFASLLNNQPMGFYAPATLVKDAKRHGVRIRAASVLHSDWLCTIEPDGPLRLGLCIVRGLNSAHGEMIVSECAHAAFASLYDFKMRTQLGQNELRVLAKIGALNGLKEHRRAALWRVGEHVVADELYLPQDPTFGGRRSHR
ncbi:MAG: error-prone polymerase [Chthoniobacter sp.]|nr:error-prone polymerase [Chthoniobacter sp.]